MFDPIIHDARLHQFQALGSKQPSEPTQQTQSQQTQSQTPNASTNTSSQAFTLTALQQQQNNANQAQNSTQTSHLTTNPSQLPTQINPYFLAPPTAPNSTTAGSINSQTLQ